jgi:hypothetical protein
LDRDGTANRLDEPYFAGVCPIASPDSADTKIRAIGDRRTTAMRRHCQFVREGIGTQTGMSSVLLDGSSTANRLDESGFAGVCPMASP